MALRPTIAGNIALRWSADFGIHSWSIDIRLLRSQRVICCGVGHAVRSLHLGTAPVHLTQPLLPTRPSTRVGDSDPCPVAIEPQTRQNIRAR